VANQVRILAVLNMVLGGVGVLIAGVFFAGGTILPMLLSHVSEGNFPVVFIQILVTVLVGLILVLSLPSLIVGYGLWNLRPWARIMGIVLSVLNLLNIPFGTALALYGFWVLLQPETEALFRQPVAA
jgi:hypothetical protein